MSGIMKASADQLLIKVADPIRAIMALYVERIVLALAVLGLSVLVGSLLSHGLRKMGGGTSLRRNRLYRLIAGSARTAVVTIGAISALGTLGVNIAALVTGLGLTGFGLGLALKDAISNLVAGLMILLNSPFDLDDTIEVGGIKGIVRDINLRYVTLETDHEHVLVPNGNFVSSVIKRAAGRSTEGDVKPEEREGLGPVV